MLPPRPAPRRRRLAPLLLRPARLLVRALLCSARQAATRRARAALFDSSRRGASRSFAAECEPLARTQRIATQVFTVDARSRGGLMRTQWQPFWEHVSVHKNLKYPCGGECATDAPMAASSASLLQLACGARIRGILKPNQKHVIPNLERTTITPSLSSTFTTDNAPAGRHAATYTHLRRKIGNAIVTRVWQPTRRWQLPSASRLQLARGSSTARRVAMRCCLLFASKFRAFRFEF